MITNIFLAAAVACLVTAMIFTAKSNLRMQKELTDATRELGRIRNQMDILESKYVTAISDSAWLRGLRTGQKQTEDELKEEE